jgi:hypothetical protein
VLGSVVGSRGLVERAGQGQTCGEPGNHPFIPSGTHLGPQGPKDQGCSPLQGPGEVRMSCRERAGPVRASANEGGERVPPGASLRHGWQTDSGGPSASS